MDAHDLKIPNTSFNDNPEINTIPGQNIIDLTNQFYLEMSKSLLSENEYEILKKILIEKRAPEVLEEENSNDET